MSPFEIVLLVVYCGVVLGLALIERKYRRVTRERIATLERTVWGLANRVDVCDICGRTFVDGEPGTVRMVPYATTATVAHPFCLQPIPADVPVHDGRSTR